MVESRKRVAMEFIMIDYMKKHESYVLEVLAKNHNKDILKELLAYHDKQIQWMQHERLVHLIVMLFICLLTLLVFVFTLTQTSVLSIILFVILLVLSGAYIMHYYRLENGVQRWYLISNQIQNTFLSKKD
jgi:cell division protein FtsW (lipid II flippase)